MKITLLFLSVVFCCIAVELSHGWFSGRGGSSRSSSVSSGRSWSRPRTSIRSRSWTRARTSVSRRRSWSRPSRRSWTRARTSVSRRRSWSRPSRRSWTRTRTSVSRRRSWSRPSRGSWTRARTSVSRRRSWTRRRRTPIRIKTWRRGSIVKTWKNAVRKAKKTWRKVKNSRFGKKIQKYHKKAKTIWNKVKNSKFVKKVQKYHKKFQNSKVGKFWKKYKNPIKLAGKILTRKPIGASLIAAEIAAEAYMKKFPNTKLTKALKKAKRFGKKHKVVKLLYGAAKIFLRKRELDEIAENRSTRKVKGSGDGGPVNANDVVEADKAIPCELITYDVDKNGEVTVNEFRLYISKLGIKGDPSVLERIDENHDGEISKEELQNFQDEMEKRNYVVDCD